MRMGGSSLRNVSDRILILHKGSRYLKWRIVFNHNYLNHPNVMIKNITQSSKWCIHYALNCLKKGGLVSDSIRMSFPPTSFIARQEAFLFVKVGMGAWHSSCNVRL